MTPTRIPRRLFRDSLVSGRILLKLTDDSLVDVGITHRIHRLAILEAISDLKSAASSSSSSAAAATCKVPTLALGAASVSTPHEAGGGSGGSGFSSPLGHPRNTSFTDGYSVAARQSFDVFLSYRRLGGSDFAQLMKIQLQAHGLSVFLDTDNRKFTCSSKTKAERGRSLCTLRLFFVFSSCCDHLLWWDASLVLSRRAHACFPRPPPYTPATFSCQSAPANSRNR